MLSELYTFTYLVFTENRVCDSVCVCVFTFLTAAPEEKAYRK